MKRSSGRKGIDKNILEIVLKLERKIITPESTALLLFSAFIFGIAATGLVFIQADPEMSHAEVAEGNVAGRIVDSDGKYIEGAVVKLKELDREVETNKYGYFYFPSVSPGKYDLMASAAGYTVKIYHIEVDGTHPRMYLFSLPPGSGSEYTDMTSPPSPPSYGAMRLFIGSVFLLGSICALLASVSAFKRKGFKRTLTLASLGVLSYGFIVGSILAGMAALFIMTEKHSYGKEEEEEEKEELFCGICDLSIDKEEGYVECRCGTAYHFQCSLGTVCSSCGQIFNQSQAPSASPSDPLPPAP
ncbi:MAG: carboxypeptidase regulatory-like domain-containing protein [Thermoplasmata archaeon]|nr:carboxypeptidase regulatory-like domain-containing protein [Thermoplasmata archaeon]